MPFELGLFFGAKHFGANEQKTKNALVFEKVKYSYMQSISDLNGIDTKAHNNDPYLVIRKIRDWLSTASKRAELPGYRIIQNEYVQFQARLSKIARKTGFEIDSIPFNDFCKIVERYLQGSPQLTRHQE